MSEKNPSISTCARLADPSVAIVQEAADLAYRARVRAAIARLTGPHYMEELVRRRNAAGITVHRWFALRGSTRLAASPAEFQAFALVLQVSPRWLAIGMGLPSGWEEPPVGWEIFGAHIDRPEIDLEFSVRTDESGMPLFERERVLSTGGAT